mmetsp:Transcript_34433/g.63006  ORF Transcript_34433/g.63006 Transcript_34433/m.63006 type:complete len:278 (+) Transcript_34433:111-944(+)
MLCKKNDFSEFEQPVENKYFASVESRDGVAEFDSGDESKVDIHDRMSAGSVSRVRPVSDPRSLYSKRGGKRVVSRQFLKRGDGVKNAWKDSTSPVRAEERRTKGPSKPPVPRMAKASAPQLGLSDVPDFVERNKAFFANSKLKAEEGGQINTPRAVRAKPGEIPRYLQNLKKKRAVEAKRAAKECAQREDEAQRGRGVGEALPEEERLAILSGLKHRRRQVEFEFQRFSHVTSHGPRRLRYVEALAKEMDDLDAMIGKIDSPVVVVAQGLLRQAWGE